MWQNIHPKNKYAATCKTSQGRETLHLWYLQQKVTIPPFSLFFIFSFSQISIKFYFIIMCSFIEKSHLSRHKSFHTDERLFQCPVCKKTYKTERCLKVHSQLHWNFRPYVCSLCGKGFLSSTKLKVSWANELVDRRQFISSNYFWVWIRYWLKVWINLGSLQQHHNCHTGERPFACKYCEKTFTNYPNWMKHTRRRHKVDHKTGLSLKEEYQAKVPTAIESKE